MDSIELIDRPEVGTVLEAIRDGEPLVHVSGEPGVGKSCLLEQLAAQSPDEVTVTGIPIQAFHTVADERVHVEVRESIESELSSPGQFKRLLRRLTGFSTPLGGFSLEPVDRDPWEELRRLGELYPDSATLVLFLDDVHQLTRERSELRDFLRKLSDSLPENVPLVTTGQLRFDPDSDGIPNVDLPMFDRAQTHRFLEANLPGLAERAMDKYHDRLSGHPYYLGQLVESNDPEGALEVPTDEIRTFIQHSYVDQLDEAEERFLTITAPLLGLEKWRCGYLYRDRFGLEPNEALTTCGRLLRSLHERGILREVAEYKDAAIYTMHDELRSFLRDRTADEAAIHRRMLAYQCEVVLVEEAGLLDLRAIRRACAYHVGELFDGTPTVDEALDEFAALDVPLDALAPYLDALVKLTEELDDEPRTFRDLRDFLQVLLVARPEAVDAYLTKPGSDTDPVQAFLGQSVERAGHDLPRFMDEIWRPRHGLPLSKRQTAAFERARELREICEQHGLVQDDTGRGESRIGYLNDRGEFVEVGSDDDRDEE